MANIQSGVWRSNCPNLTDVMSKAKDTNLFTDVTFVIGEDPFKKTFHAHKLILASGSPVFESMFFGDMAEKRNPIVIEEDDPEAFDLLINYIYGKAGKIKLNSFYSAWSYYSIGDKYLVEGIRDDVERFVEHARMTEEDFWNLIEGNLHNNPIFKKKLSSYFSKNSEKMLMSESFRKIPESLLMNILQMDRLNVSEYELLQQVAKWGISNNADELKMKHLMRHIRFSTLNVEDFCDFTDRFPNAIDTRSCVDIMKHLHKKSVYKLPDWCSTNNNSRNAAFRVSENTVRQKSVEEVNFAMQSARELNHAKYFQNLLNHNRNNNGKISKH